MFNFNPCNTFLFMFFKLTLTCYSHPPAKFINTKFVLSEDLAHFLFFCSGALGWLEVFRHLSKVDWLIDWSIDWSFFPFLLLFAKSWTNCAQKNTCDQILSKYLFLNKIIVIMKITVCRIQDNRVWRQSYFKEVRSSYRQEQWMVKSRSGICAKPIPILNMSQYHFILFLILDME